MVQSIPTVELLPSLILVTKPMQMHVPIPVHLSINLGIRSKYYVL